MTNVFDISEESSIFKDKKPLDPDIKPSREELVCREDQINQLVSHLEDLIRYDTAKNFLITGDTGVGKTATTQIVLDDLEEMMADKNFQSVYMTDLKNERDVLRKISRKMELDYYGRSDLEEYYDRLEKKLYEEDIKLALVMDEVNRLFEKKTSKDHGNSVFKRLLEVRSSLNSKDKGYLMLIGITNRLDTTDQFSPRVESRFGKETVHFPAYNAVQLRQILEERSQNAFRPGAINNGAVSKAASLVGNKDGDARKAIILLKKAAEIAEQEQYDKIQIKHIDKAEEQLETRRILDAVDECSKQSKLVLYSVLQLQGRKEITTGRTYSKYEHICKKAAMDPLSQRRVRDLIDKLDMMGLITAKIESRGNKGRTRMMRINYDDDTVQSLEDELEKTLMLD